MTTHTTTRAHDETAAAVRLRDILDRLREAADLPDNHARHSSAALVEERDRLLSTFADVVLCRECGDVLSVDEIRDHDRECSSWDLRPFVSVLSWSGHRGWRMVADFVETVADDLADVPYSLDDEDREILDAYRYADGEETTSEVVHDLADRAESVAGDAGYLVEWDDGLSLYREVLSLDGLVSVPAREIRPGDVVPVVTSAPVSVVSAPSWEGGSGHALRVRVWFASGTTWREYAADEVVHVIREEVRP